jgi:hypothetical protein
VEEEKNNNQNNKGGDNDNMTKWEKKKRNPLPILSRYPPSFVTCCPSLSSIDAHGFHVSSYATNFYQSNPVSQPCISVAYYENDTPSRSQSACPQ